MSLASMQGGVEVPRKERPWAKRLTRNFDHLNPEIQGSIISIIQEIRSQDPEKAKDTAHRISDFFSHTGEYAKDSNVSIKDFLTQLQQELEVEQRKHIQ